jgi:hypothetical protein
VHYNVIEWEASVNDWTTKHTIPRLDCITNACKSAWNIWLDVSPDFSNKWQYFLRTFLAVVSQPLKKTIHNFTQTRIDMTRGCEKRFHSEFFFSGLTFNWGIAVWVTDEMVLLLVLDEVAEVTGVDELVAAEVDEEEDVLEWSPPPEPLWLLVEAGGTEREGRVDDEWLAWSSDRMVAISFCMNAQGTLDPNRGHRCPDGQ